MGTGFFGGILECEVWKLGERGVRADDAGEEVAGGVVDGCDDEVIGLGDVLDKGGRISLVLEPLVAQVVQREPLTLPLLFSTQIAFFRRSMLS